MHCLVDAPILQQAFLRIKAGVSKKKKKDQKNPQAYVLLHVSSEGGIRLTSARDDLTVSTAVTESVLVREGGTLAVHYQQCASVLKHLQGRITLEGGDSTLTLSWDETPAGSVNIVARKEQEGPPLPPFAVDGALTEKTVFHQETCVTCGAKHRRSEQQRFQFRHVHREQFQIGRSHLLAHLKEVAFLSDVTDGGTTLCDPTILQLEPVNDMLRLVAVYSACFVCSSFPIEHIGNWTSPVQVSTRRFIQLVELFPADATLLLEVVWAECSALDEKSQSVDAAVVSRQRSHLRIATEELDIKLMVEHRPFPDYQRLLAEVEQEHSRVRFTCVASELAHVLRLLAPVAEGWEKPVRIQVSTERLIVEPRTSHGEQHGSQILIPARTEGISEGTRSILFSASLLLAFLNTLSDSQVMIELADEKTEAKLTALLEHQHLVYILMPMKGHEA